MFNLIGAESMVHCVNINPLVKAYLPGDQVDILHIFGNGLFHLLPSLTNSKLAGSPFLVFLFCLLALLNPLFPLFVLCPEPAEIIIQLVFNLSGGLFVLSFQPVLRLPDYLFCYLVRSVHRQTPRLSSACPLRLFL